MKTINYNGNEYTQVQKRTAEKLYNEGKTISLIPCNANPNGMFYGLFDVNISAMDEIDVDISKRSGQSLFQKMLCNFEYYNCNVGLGRYAHFYIIK